MAKQEEAPFARGTTYNDTDGTIDLNNLGGINLEGKEYIFEDQDPRSAAGVAATRTGRPVKCRIVRNLSGTTLFGKYCALLGVTAGKVTQYASGLVATAATRGFPIDEYLPPAGVRNGDLFYVVVQGPAIMRTSMAGDITNSIALNAHLVAQTAVTSGATTAGRVGVRDTSLTAATSGVTTYDTTGLYDMIANRIGLALSARTTGETNADILVDTFLSW